MNRDLRLAIKGLYSAFRQRGSAPLVRGCPCCTSPAEFEHLASRPLKHLTAEELERYARKAITTVSHAEALRYFLPRIIELATEGAFLVDREVVFSKIRRGNWHEWPLHEREAVERFANAVAATFATTVYDPYELDEWICALGEFVDDLPQVLSPLLTRTPAAKANLRSVIEHNAEAAWSSELANAFWNEDNPNTDPFIAWLRRPDVRAAAA